MDVAAEVRNWPCPSRLQHLEITEEDTEWAIRCTGNKATGIDQLGIKQLKTASLRKEVVAKCTTAFNEWLNQGRVPTYCKEARVVPLSKEDSEFPSIGGIRTINILPGIFKIYEKAVLGKLKYELSATQPLHKCQAGFTEHRSTLDNIDELAVTMNEARAMAFAERRRTKTISERTKVYVCFLDLKKAFDSVDRVKLVRKLEERGIAPPLTRTLRDFLSDTVINYQSHRIGTNIGVP